MIRSYEVHKTYINSFVAPAGETITMMVITEMGYRDEDGFRDRRIINRFAFVNGKPVTVDEARRIAGVEAFNIVESHGPEPIGL